MSRKVRLTVITPTFNVETVLGDCLRSVAAQDLQCEHIIIDGASTDQTVPIARDFDHVSMVISEPDSGAYDAMNKGIRAASGDVIGILNADDMYAADQVLRRVTTVFENANVDACYGDLVYVRQDPDGAGPTVRSSDADQFRVVRYWKAGAFRPERMYWGWMPPHPTFFVRRNVYERYGLFDPGLGSAADYELILRLLLKHRIRAAYLPGILVRMRVGGISNASLIARIQANRMDRRAWMANELRPLPWTLFCKPLRKIPQWWRRPSEGDLVHIGDPILA